MSSSQNHFLWLANTVVVYIKCCDKRKQREKVALSSQNGPYEVQKFINMINLVVFFVFFQRVLQRALFLNIPLGTTLHSYDGLISHFLGRLGRHWTLGGVRPFHVGHEQAHFLIGPPPLRVQLTVIPKRHLRVDGGGETGEKRQTWIQLKARYLRQSSTDARLGRCADWKLLHDGRSRAACKKG